MTEKLIGMTEPGVPPPPFGPESVIDPHAPPNEETEASSPAEPETPKEYASIGRAPYG